MLQQGEEGMLLIIGVAFTPAVSFEKGNSCLKYGDSCWTQQEGQLHSFTLVSPTVVQYAHKENFTSVYDVAEKERVSKRHIVDDNTREEQQPQQQGLIGQDFDALDSLFHIITSQKSNCHSNSITRRHSKDREQIFSFLNLLNNGVNRCNRAAGELDQSSRQTKGKILSPQHYRFCQTAKRKDSFADKLLQKHRNYQSCTSVDEKLKGDSLCQGKVSIT